MTDRTYPHGAHCWVDCESPDPEASSSFYAGLFGWELEDAVPAKAPGSYLIATLGGDDVAAIAPAESETSASTAHWWTYVAVEDADRAAGLVAAEGGRILAEPQDAGPGGRLAVVADPQGASFRLWEARARPGAQRANDPGTWNFSALHTPDAAAAAGFYGAVFDWETDLSGGDAPTTWRLPGYGRHLEATVDPGIMERQAGVGAPPGFEDVIATLAPDTTADPPEWRVIFTVDERDAAAERAQELDAEILRTLETEWTREALIRDPVGAELTLSEFTPPGG